MTFSYVSPDRPAVWMCFTPAEQFVASAGKMTEGTVCADATNNARDVEQTAAKEHDTSEIEAAENPPENTAGPHILPVDRASQLTECEYRQDCIPVGKGRAVQLSAKSLNVTAFILTTTTGRGRDAAVVEMRMSADQVGSPDDCTVLKRIAYSRPKMFSVMAGGSKNDRLRCPKIERTFCPQAAADNALTAQKMCRENRLKSSLDAPVSRPGCWHEIDEDAVISRFAGHFINGERRNASWHKYRSIYRPSIDSSRGHLRHVRPDSFDSFSVSGILIRK